MTNLEIRIFLYALLHAWAAYELLRTWKERTDPGPVREALITTEVSTGRRTVYRIPPHLQRLVAMKGQTHRVRR